MANTLATPEEVAAWLQINTAKLSKLRRSGRGPKFIRVGRDIRYAWIDVHTWCDTNRRASTQEPTDG